MVIMAGRSGFKLLLQAVSDDAKSTQDAVPADGDFGSVAGLQAKSLNINSAEIDITSGSTDEWRTLLEGRGVRSFDVSGNGVLDDGALAKKLEARSVDNSITWFRIKSDELPNRSYTGKFKISSFNITGEHDGAILFDMSLMSSGALTIA